jgi:hypothetical protein
VSKQRTRIGRNEKCPCGSSLKFKQCHGSVAAGLALDDAAPKAAVPQFIDTGEMPIRWVISSSTGTAFFVDGAGRILVFPTKAMATEIQRHELFADQDPQELNVAGVGPSKWAHLQEILPFVEVASAEEAIAHIQARIELQTRTAESTQHDVEV